MPFVNQEHRDKPDLSIPGDRCYLEYKDLMGIWKGNPRWTNVDAITRKWFHLDETQAAHFLAYMVWFQLHVIPYELEKRSSNGDIL